MKERHKKIIDLVILFAVTGIGVSAALSLLPYINKLEAFSRIIATASAQFAIAGLGAVIVMLLRKEKFTDYGLKKENIIKSLCIGAAFTVVYLTVIYFIEGGLTWMPFRQVDVTKPALSLGFPLNIIGIIIIALSWGFFEGYTLIYISKKINSLFNITNPFLKPGPLVIILCNILIHMAMGQSFLNAASGSIATYVVVMIPELTGNSWGSILIFMMLWNAV
ncbi:MAG: hypothetical protein GYA50_02035 [Eubacteriaceae bacterium]|nr:hypothetical protein [Eubacteriaceae bacterium]